MERPSIEPGRLGRRVRRTFGRLASWFRKVDFLRLAEGTAESTKVLDMNGFSASHYFGQMAVSKSIMFGTPPQMRHGRRGPGIGENIANMFSASAGSTPSTNVTDDRRRLVQRDECRTKRTIGMALRFVPAFICTTLISLSFASAGTNNAQQQVQMPPQVTNWSNRSEHGIDRSITILGNEVTFPNLGKYKLEYYRDYPVSNAGTLSPHVFRITPEGKLPKYPPFCLSDNESTSGGFVSILQKEDALGRPAIIFSGVGPAQTNAFMKNKVDTSLQSCFTVFFVKTDK